MSDNARNNATAHAPTDTKLPGNTITGNFAEEYTPSKNNPVENSEPEQNNFKLQMAEPTTHGKSRRWCFTVNNYTENDIANLTQNIQAKGVYYIFSKEVGTKGTPHLQGYCEFQNRKDLKTLKNQIHNTAHWSIARADATTNKTYIEKDENEGQTPKGPEDIYTWGDPIVTKQGRRTDIEGAIAVLKSDGMQAMSRAFPSEYVKFSTGFTNWEVLNLGRPEVRTQKTTVHVYYGKTGSGKSLRAREQALFYASKRKDDKFKTPEEDIYYKNKSDKWWDEYRGQTSVIIDDFYGWIQYDQILRLCDRYPLSVEYKGGSTQFNSQHIFITSNEPPENWYRFTGYDPAALLRRVDGEYFYFELQKSNSADIPYVQQMLTDMRHTRDSINDMPIRPDLRFPTQAALQQQNESGGTGECAATHEHGEQTLPNYTTYKNGSLFQRRDQFANDGQ